MHDPPDNNFRHFFNEIAQACFGPPGAEHPAPLRELSRERVRERNFSWHPADSDAEIVTEIFKVLFLRFYVLLPTVFFQIEI